MRTLRRLDKTGKRRGETSVWRTAPLYHFSEVELSGTLTGSRQLAAWRPERLGRLFSGSAVCDAVQGARFVCTLVDAHSGTRVSCLGLRQLVPAAIPSMICPDKCLQALNVSETSATLIAKSRESDELECHLPFQYEESSHLSIQNQYSRSSTKHSVSTRHHRFPSLLWYFARSP